MTSGSRWRPALAGLGKSARRGARPSAASTGRRPPPTGGTRADQAVKIISENPGIKVSELGKQDEAESPELPVPGAAGPREGRPGPPQGPPATTPASPQQTTPALA